MTIPSFRLDIWRPAHPECRFVYAEPSNAVKELDENRLHKHVYSWKPSGDFWGSLRSEDSNKLRDLFFGSFSSELPPDERGVDKLKKFLGDLDHILNDDANRNWQMWEQPVHQDNENRLYQLQPSLSLYHHLKWLCEVFQDIPGASVTVR